ncbi:hypothetical protein HBI83_161230 [Parastagonospora nodorum]|nr:hypothetical protein HBI83_161230 [Parastagonospora nodorum]
MTLQFQSTLAFLKTPPHGYQQPPVDVIEVLGDIQRNITSGVYKKQYSFEADVQLLISRMHDSHVTLSSGIMNAFSFVSPYGIVSASSDGKQLPEIYIAEDIRNGRLHGYKPTPINKINGRDAVEFLAEFATLNTDGYVEPHADWNSLMDSPALYISGDLSIFQSATFYPGDKLEVTFKNGTPHHAHWLSIYNELDNPGPLTTAGDFYNYFVLGLKPASYKEGSIWWPIDPAHNETSSGNAPSINLYEEICSSGHPSQLNWCQASSGTYPNDPVVSQPDLAITGGGVVSGYFLKDMSTGVLSVPTFMQFDPNTGFFQDTVEYFIGNATQQNISRIVIDLQTNSGGEVFLAYNTFKQFFYNIDPYAATRIRSHELTNVLGAAYSEWWKGLETDLDANGFAYSYAAAEEWIAVNRINAATGSNFSSWADYYGRVSDHGDLFSAAQRYNLSNEVFDIAAFEGWVPYGYGINKADTPSPQPWAPNDVVILTDGLCASACAVFVEMMTQAGVRTVAVGGRPEPGPMQAVGGSRGARVYHASELDEDFGFVSDTIKNSTAAAQLPSRSDTGMWITDATINIRDQVRANETTPLHFKYGAADCRIYYTLDNIFNTTRLWRDAAKATWDDRSLCVAGSTGFPSARNATSKQTPPSQTTYVPTLSLDPDSSIQVLSNITLGGIEAGDGLPFLGITSCNIGCSRGRQCLATVLRCNGAYRDTTACLPQCLSTDPNSCPETSRCDYNPGSIGSTINAYGDRAAYAFGTPLHVGFCRPTGPNQMLACPR